MSWEQPNNAVMQMSVNLDSDSMIASSSSAVAGTKNISLSNVTNPGTLETTSTAAYYKLKNAFADLFDAIIDDNVVVKVNIPMLLEGD